MDTVKETICNSDGRRYPVYNIGLNSKIMNDIFGSFMTTNKIRQLPSDVFRYPKKFLLGMFRGYLLGDGTFENFDWHLRSGGFATSSRKLASQLVFILKYKFDAKNFRYKCKVKPNGKLHYDISWNNDDYVYDFEVPETHTFIDALGNVVLHNTVVAFVPAIKDAIVELPNDAKEKLVEIKKDKYDKKFEDLYDKARNLKMAKDEQELGVMCAAYNQQIAETENELIERLGGLRKRSLILQGKEAPPVVKIGEGTKYEETHVLDIALINQITDVEKILKMKEPRWKVKKLEKKPIDELTQEEWDLVRDSYLRKELNKLVSDITKDKGVKKLYDLLREPSDYMKREFVTKSGYEGDPIGLKIDTQSRLLDRILYNEIRESDIFEDLDER
jgi:hypothetical protein